MTQKEVGRRPKADTWRTIGPPSAGDEEDSSDDGGGEGEGGGGGAPQEQVKRRYRHLRRSHVPTTRLVFGVLPKEDREVGMIYGSSKRQGDHLRWTAGFSAAPRTAAAVFPPSSIQW